MMFNIDNAMFYLLLVFALALIAAVQFVFFIESRKLAKEINGLVKFGGTHELSIQRYGMLRQVAAEVNALARKVAQRNERLAAAAHDLRTPITRIGYALDLASHAVDVDQRQQYLEKIARDIRLLDSVVEETIFGVRLESKVAGNKGRWIIAKDTHGWLSENVVEARDYADAANSAVKVSYSITEGALFGDVHLLSRLLSNLLSNAIKHARTKVHVHVVCGATNEIVIEDDGPGMVGADGSAAFSQRALTANALSDCGIDRQKHGGIGLAIVARIVQLHAGSVRILTSRWGGARVEVSWPSPQLREAVSKNRMDSTNELVRHAA